MVDLSFPHFDKSAAVTVLPPELAVMMVGVTARQAASPTALFFARLASGASESRLFAPAHGAFNESVAAALRGWQEA